MTGPAGYHPSGHKRNLTHAFFTEGINGHERNSPLALFTEGFDSYHVISYAPPVSNYETNMLGLRASKVSLHIMPLNQIEPSNLVQLALHN